MSTAQLTIRNDMTVKFKDHMGGDSAVIEAMLVSTEDAEVIEAMLDQKTTYGRINFLMANRHGTPFEHAAMKFYVEAPIAVFREFHRHRIGFSYNEQSGRYRQLPPTFYVPGPDRPLIQVGKAGAYEFISTPDDELLIRTVKRMCHAYSVAYQEYEEMLADGVAKEVARMVLPVGLYSAMYVTCNPRSMMSFLGLRTKHELAKFPSFPMYEIEEVARGMETHFARLFPLVYKAFCLNGRVSP